MTIIDNIMESNKWPYAYSAGYADGRRDKTKGRNKYIGLRERTEYAQGYHKGYSS